MEKKKIKNKYIKSLIKKNRVIGIQEICKDPLKVKKLKRNINSRYLIFKKAFLDSKKNKISFNGKPKLMVACSEMHDRSKVSSLFQYRISQDNRNPFYVKLDEKHRQYNWVKKIFQTFFLFLIFSKYNLHSNLFFQGNRMYLIFSPFKYTFFDSKKKLPFFVVITTLSKSKFKKVSIFKRFPLNVSPSFVSTNNGKFMYFSEVLYVGKTRSYIDLIYYKKNKNLFLNPMDSNSWIEQVQFQLNFLEFFYQKRIKKKAYHHFNGNYFRKLFYEVGFLISGLFMFKSSFIINHFEKFGFSFPSFFTIQPWFIFWLRNSIDLIGGGTMPDFTKLVYFLEEKIIFENRMNSDFLIGSKSLLILYATVLSGLFSFKEIVNENQSYPQYIYYFLRKLKTDKNSFRASFLGENDPRTFYCVYILSSLYNILTPELFFGVDKIFRLYQNHEGGGSIDRQGEGHGAISFCYLATMVFCLKKPLNLDLDFQTKNWILEKQTFLDFGFHGRISKLSDSCYSFWVGAISIITNLSLCKETKTLLCSFQEKFSSGLVDKIGRAPDLYHSCYFLSSLSLFNFFNGSNNLLVKKNNLSSNSFFSKINPVFGIREKVLLKNIYNSSRKNLSVFKKNEKN